MIGQTQICFFRKTPVRDMPRLMLPEAHVICAWGPAARELPVADVADRKYFNGLNRTSPV
jgi:hypothetical protein